MDYAALLEDAGLAVVPRRPGVGYVGTLALRDADGGALVAAAVPFGTPAYAAGIERDDVIVSIGGRQVDVVADVVNAVSSGAPGDRLPVAFMRRGTRVTAEIVLGEDPYVDVLPAELAGRPVSDAQRAFRDAWLGSRAAN
jgi:S1-C subfamily serine protease